MDRREGGGGRRRTDPPSGGRAKSGRPPTRAMRRGREAGRLVGLACLPQSTTSSRPPAPPNAAMAHSEDPISATSKATKLPLPEPESFSFPYATPYPIQTELMYLVYRAIEDEKIAIVQSPTGTVSTLARSRARWLGCARVKSLTDASRRRRVGLVPLCRACLSGQESLAPLLDAHLARWVGVFFSSYCGALPLIWLSIGSR